MRPLCSHAQDALFEFTGHHPTEPTNWQKPENWNLNGLAAARTPGTGPDDVVVINGTVSNPANTVKDITLNGSITGGFLNISRNLILNAGAINACTVTLLDNASLTTSSASANGFNSCVVINRGTFAPMALGLGSFGGNPPTVLTNEVAGKIWLNDGSAINCSSGARIDSFGQVLKLAGTNTALISGGKLTQSGAGSVGCAGGTLSLGSSPGGAFISSRPIVPSGTNAVIEITGSLSELKAGSDILGLGVVRFINAAITGPIAVDNFELSDGATLQGPGDVTLYGTFNFRGGTFQGELLNGNINTVSPAPKLDIQPGAILKLTVNNSSPVLNRNVRNAGTILHAISSPLGVSGSVTNTPTLDNLVGGTIILSSVGTLGNRSLNNAGTLTKTTNTDLSSGVLLGGICTNTGLIDVQIGLLRLSGLRQTAGELRLAAGTEVRFNSGPTSTITGGLITGNGTLRGFSSSATAMLGGTLRPGASPGTFTIIRTDASIDFAPASQIEIEIGGMVAGTQHDQLILNGVNFPLGGAVVVKFINGFIPSPGQVFPVIRYPSGRSGTFNSFTGLDSAPGVVLVPRYTAAGIDLLVATNPPTISVMSASPGNFKFNYQTSPGFNFQVEASTNLLNWNNLGLLVTGDGQLKEFTNAITGIPARFYRVRME